MPEESRSLGSQDWRVGIVPVRVWFAVAVVVALVAVAAVWSVTSRELGGPVSARETQAVAQQAPSAADSAPKTVADRETRPRQAVADVASAAQPAEAPGEVASKVPDTPTDDAPPAFAMKQAAQEQDLRGGLHIGGHSRLMDSFIGVVDVDESDVAKTINVHILRDENYDYYFDLDSQTLPAGEKVMFVVNNTHFTPDECW